MTHTVCINVLYANVFKWTEGEKRKNMALVISKKRKEKKISSRQKYKPIQIQAVVVHSPPTRAGTAAAPSPMGGCALSLSGVYTSNLFNDWIFIWVKYCPFMKLNILGQTFSQNFCFIEGRQYLAQIKFQIV